MPCRKCHADQPFLPFLPLKYKTGDIIKIQEKDSGKKIVGLVLDDLGPFVVLRSKALHANRLVYDKEKILILDVLDQPSLGL